MTTYTDNINLDLYEGTDKPNLLDQYNSAMRKIDTILSTPFDSSMIANGAIGTAQLADGAVTSEKLENGAVVNEKIANSAVSATKILDGAVTGEKIADATITADKYTAGSVGTDVLADGAVTKDKIAADAIAIADNSITNAMLQDGAVSQSKIDDNAIVGSKIQDNTINYSKLGTNLKNAAYLNINTASVENDCNYHWTAIYVNDNGIFLRATFSPSVQIATNGHFSYTLQKADFTNDAIIYENVYQAIIEASFNSIPYFTYTYTNSKNLVTFSIRNMYDGITMRVQPTSTAIASGDSVDERGIYIPNFSGLPLLS